MSNSLQLYAHVFGDLLQAIEVRPTNVQLDGLAGLLPQLFGEVLNLLVEAQPAVERACPI